MNTKKVFKVTYSSEGNLVENPKLIIEADNIGEAQDKFVSYLKTSGLWQHMWQLSMKFEESKFIK